jgi:8-oxo-dGTP diphosphatase
MIDKVAWIEIQDGRILSTRSHGKDVYYLPGGKREPGESDLDTLVREIGEELPVAILPATTRRLGTFEDQAHGHSGGAICEEGPGQRQHPGPPSTAQTPGACARRLPAECAYVRALAGDSQVPT